MDHALISKRLDGKCPDPPTPPKNLRITGAVVMSKSNVSPLPAVALQTYKPL